MTNKQRMLMAMRGEMPDVIPFAPRLDLWFTANKALGTLPKAYRDCTHHSQVALAEGWGLHQINPAYQETRKPEDNLHWALGVLTYKETVFGYRFGGDVEIEVDQQPARTHPESPTTPPRARSAPPRFTPRRCAAPAPAPP
jgi:hypothetical protein